MPDSLHPMDLSPPGSSVHVIFQVRILEWVAISYSRVSSQPRDQTHVSCISCFGRQILYHRTSWEALITAQQLVFHCTEVTSFIYSTPYRLMFRMLYILQYYKHSCIKYYTLANHSVGYLLTTKTTTFPQDFAVDESPRGSAQSLVRKDPACLGAAKRAHHDY